MTTLTSWSEVSRRVFANRLLGSTTGDGGDSWRGVLVNWCMGAGSLGSDLAEPPYEGSNSSRSGELSAAAMP